MIYLEAFDWLYMLFVNNWIGDFLANVLKNNNNTLERMCNCTHLFTLLEEQLEKQM